MGENIANDAIDKGLVSKIYKQFIQLYMYIYICVYIYVYIYMCVYIYIYIKQSKKNGQKDSPVGPRVKNPPANAGNLGSIPDLGRFYMP